MHMFSSSQLAKIYALKHSLNPELSSVIAISHDIAVVNGKFRKNHDSLAKPYVIEEINDFNSAYEKDLNITEEEISIILMAISTHSQKDIYTDNLYSEMLKNVDSLDRFLYGLKTEGSYKDRVNILLNIL